MSSGILSAQSTATVALPDATVGVPYSFNFFNQASLVDHVASTGFAAGYYGYSLATGSTFPPGLTADFSAISGTPTQAGKFNFTVDFYFFFHGRRDAETGNKRQSCFLSTWLPTQARRLW